MATATASAASTATTIDELARIRAELDHLVGVRSADRLSPREQLRYEALLLREGELLTCRVSAQRRLR